jgi:GNAT superfamily N-acetyltransferase
MTALHFSQRVRRVFASAQSEAKRLGHDALTPWHLLLALVADRGGVSHGVLEAHRVDPDRLRDEALAKLAKPRAPIVTDADLPYTHDAKELLERSMYVAAGMSHTYVGTEHLLLALGARGGGKPAALLAAHGLDADGARPTVRRLLGPPADVPMSQDIELREEPARDFVAYATVPATYETDETLAPDADIDPLGGIPLAFRARDVTLRKDYDALPHDHPTAWPARFDVSGWGVLSAWRHGQRVGGAVVTFRAPGVERERGRHDVAVLWDLRVHPAHRGAGVGTALFRAAEGWARSRGARWLSAETQNTNPGACRFYAARGCRLGTIDRHAYPELPGEIMLVWYRELET